MPNKYSFSGSTAGLTPPTSFGENWGSNTGNPAFNNPYIAGQGINPQAPNLYDDSAIMNWGNPDAGSNFRIAELAQAPVTNAAFNAAGSAAPQGLWGSIGQWAKDSGFVGSKGLDGIQTGGWGAPAIQGASALMNGFMGMKQYGLSKKIFENNKQQFERNFDAQKGLTSMALEDKFARRNNDMAANGMTPTRSVEDSMKRYGVK